MWMKTPRHQEPCVEGPQAELCLDILINNEKARVAGGVE